MIYTPRACIDALTSPTSQDHKQVCTKIELNGFEISIAMDSSYSNGNLSRSDIRVWRIQDQTDITDLFLEEGETMLYGDAVILLRVMKQIEKMVTG